MRTLIYVVGMMTILFDSPAQSLVVKLDTILKDMPDWEDSYHSADDDSLRKVGGYKYRKNYTKRNSKADLQQEAKRVGCICMDGVERYYSGKGACAGHQGVRYWVYRRSNGDTLMVATIRQKLHPKALSPEKHLSFGAKPAKKQSEPRFPIYIFVTISFSCTIGIYGLTKRKNKNS